MRCIGVSFKSCFPGSDDHGEVWKVAHTDGQDATEGEVVELFPEKNQDEQEKATKVIGSNPTLLYTIRAGGT